MTVTHKYSVERWEQEYRPALMVFFQRRLGDRSEAEDLTQEVFLRVSQTDNGSIASGTAYIFRVAANLLRDRARRKTIRDAYAAEIQASDARVDLLDPHRVASARETLDAMMVALASLPERTRQIFLLYRYEQVDRATIASGFGISVSAVEKHVYRAMACLVAATGEGS